jgi:glycosyltransferase involved in cell wall biosynthesis
MAYPNIEYWNNNNPIKLLEYLALGKVVICSDIWTFRNVMKNSKCCCYIKNNDPKNIAAGITYCYENRDKLKTWGREGVEIVSGRFTWGRQAQELLNFIKLLNPKII